MTYVLKISRWQNHLLHKKILYPCKKFYGISKIENHVFQFWCLMSNIRFHFYVRCKMLITWQNTSSRRRWLNSHLDYLCLRKCLSTNISSHRFKLNHRNRLSVVCHHKNDIIFGSVSWPDFNRFLRSFLDPKIPLKKRSILILFTPPLTVSGLRGSRHPPPGGYPPGGWYDPPHKSIPLYLCPAHHDIRVLTHLGTRMLKWGPDVRHTFLHIFRLLQNVLRAGSGTLFLV